MNEKLITPDKSALALIDILPYDGMRLCVICVAQGLMRCLLLPKMHRFYDYPFKKRGLGRDRKLIMNSAISSLILKRTFNFKVLTF